MKAKQLRLSIVVVIITIIINYALMEILDITIFDEFQFIAILVVSILFTCFLFLLPSISRKTINYVYPEYTLISSKGLRLLRKGYVKTLSHLDQYKANYYLLENRTGKIINTLRKRTCTYRQKMTYYKNEGTDINVLKSEAREQLSIELMKAGILKFDIKEFKYREKDKISVTAILNVSVFKEMEGEDGSNS